MFGLVRAKDKVPRRSNPMIPGGFACNCGQRSCFARRRNAADCRSESARADPGCGRTSQSASSNWPLLRMEAGRAGNNAFIFELPLPNDETTHVLLDNGIRSGRSVVFGPLIDPCLDELDLILRQPFRWRSRPVTFRHGDRRVRFVIEQPHQRTSCAAAGDDHPAVFGAFHNALVARHAESARHPAGRSGRMTGYATRLQYRVNVVLKANLPPAAPTHGDERNQSQFHQSQRAHRLSLFSKSGREPMAAADGPEPTTRRSCRQTRLPPR